MKYLLQKEYDGAEKSIALWLDLPREVTSDPVGYDPTQWVPIGTVEFCEALLNKTPEPIYYPAFLKEFRHRNVWWSQEINQTGFYKPADRHKRFDGRVCSPQEHFAPKFVGKEFLNGPYWVSETVDFGAEWRVYVADGKVIASHWYIQDRQKGEPPKIKTDWEEWSGAVDFGYLPDGEIALVENNLPYACGWYGGLNDGQPFIDWLTVGWKWVLKNYHMSFR